MGRLNFAFPHAVGRFDEDALSRPATRMRLDAAAGFQLLISPGPLFVVT